jgi:hypothetical protein
MRFSGLPAHLTEGYRALKIIELPLTTQPHGIQVDTPEQVAAREGTEPVKVFVGLRALTPGERSEVLSAAYAYSVSKGASDDVERTSVYLQALAVYTVAAAAVDPDSDRKRPLLFFGDSLEQAADTIRKSPLMTDDIVLYLRERCEAWSDQINPQSLSVKDSELYDVIKKAADDADFFFCCRPGLLVNLANFMARTLLISLEPNSDFGGSLDADGESSNEKPKKTQKTGK